VSLEPTYPFSNKNTYIMSCDFISNGRLLPCKDQVGGLKNVYFMAYGVDSTLVTTSGSQDTVAAADFADVTAYKFAIKGNSSLTQTIQSSRENGTTVFQQVLELTLPSLSKEDNYQVKLLSFGRPHVVVEDYNGNFFLVGREHGADVTGGTIVTGAAMGDLSGYTLSFTAMERTPANLLSGSFIGGSAGTDGPTIDDGAA
jgi:hypothetical protein